MKGDKLYLNFFFNLKVLILSVMLIATANHLILLLLGWALTSWTLIKLMVHKSIWKAASESGKLARNFFILGFLSLSFGFLLLYLNTGTASIQEILKMSSTQSFTLPLLFILIGALVQSAVWPFHKWLLSSLNSPTPVSAIMHAGIINGGGFLLMRFAPLYFKSPQLLNLIFIMGLISVVAGTFWKLMQSDIKRMLACSTMSQMGFMLIQCGLGLFISAIAHLCWHGMFKAYLFLSSGSSAQTKKIPMNTNSNLISLVLALFCGCIGAYLFSRATHINCLSKDTTIFLPLITLIGGTQLALSILNEKPFKKFFLALLFTLLASFLYGKGLYFFESFLHVSSLTHPQKLNFLHYTALTLLPLGWLSIFWIRNPSKNGTMPSWMSYLYVKALNQSQPHPKTITTHRKDYQYV